MFLRLRSDVTTNSNQLFTDLLLYYLTAPKQTLQNYSTELDAFHHVFQPPQSQMCSMNGVSGVCASKFFFFHQSRLLFLLYACHRPREVTRSKLKVQEFLPSTEQNNNKNWHTQLTLHSIPIIFLMVTWQKN